MAQSDYTKVTRKKLWLFRILDAICLFSPVIIYFFIGITSDGVTSLRKFALATMVTVALILTVVNVIAQKRLRCPIWIILVGLYIAIEKWLLPLIIILAVTSVMDDFLFTPIIAHYKQKLEASKVIDERKEEGSI